MKLLCTLFSTINNKVKNNHKLKDLKNIMNKYNGSDWKDHLLFSEDKYNRNVIYSNECIEMIIISWNNNQTSGIHDHPRDGCLMKILQGDLDEHIHKNNNNLDIIDIHNCEEGSVGYQEGNDILHNIVNKNNKTVSLHIYSPPNYKSTKY